MVKVGAVLLLPVSGLNEHGPNVHLASEGNRSLRRKLTCYSPSGALCGNNP